MSFHLDATKAALILIDLQHGIINLPVQPHSAEAVVQKSRCLVDAFREKGAQIVYVRVNLSDMQPLAVDRSHVDPAALPLPPIASEIVPAAGFQEGDLLVTKRHWGAFGPTGLEQTLKVRGVETIILAGLVTNLGVESSARQAVAHGFNVVLVEDACSALDADAHKFAFENIFPLLARVRSAQEVINALN